MKPSVKEIGLRYAFETDPVKEAELLRLYKKLIKSKVKKGKKK